MRGLLTIALLGIGWIAGCNKSVPNRLSHYTVLTAVVYEVSCNGDKPCQCAYLEKGQTVDCGVLKGGETKDFIGSKGTPYTFSDPCAAASNSDEGCLPFTVQQSTTGDCSANIVGSGGTVSVNCEEPKAK